MEFERAATSLPLLPVSIPCAALAPLDDVTFEQGDGQKPDIGLAASFPGENGIGLARFHFTGGAYTRGAAPHHLLIFNLGQPAFISCHAPQQRLDHVAPTGNITICPADIEFGAESMSSLSILVLTLPKEAFAGFSAQHAKLGASLPKKLSGCDASLFGAARDLADEAASGFSSGPRYWTELTDALFDHLLDRYLPADPSPGRHMLTRETLARINEYVVGHLGEPIDVDTIADLAMKGHSQFPRIFRRTVGMSPYQYLVRLRLKHALSLMKAGEMSLAEVAVATGFVDQSHLCRWIKRIYGTSPARLATEARKSPRPV